MAGPKPVLVAVVGNDMASRQDPDRMVMTMSCQTSAGSSPVVEP